MNLRVGTGYDVHRLVVNRDLWIGGISIPHKKGAAGPSDGDALIHSICDALLGALNESILDESWSDGSSSVGRGKIGRDRLKFVNQLMKKHKAQIVNIDATIILQSPKIATYIPEIRSNIASLLEVDVDRISVKSKSNDGLGYIGEGDGMAAISSILISV